MNVTKREYKTEGIPPFLSIERACEVTGLSQYFLRNGCKSGDVPHVRSGRVYLINIPALLRKLDAEGGN